MADPTASRPKPDYMATVEQLPWSWALERLEAERNYWLVTPRRTGFPQARPVWGLWEPEGLFLSKWGLARTIHKSALPATVHVDNARNAVIVEGVVDRIATARSSETGAEPTLEIDHQRVVEATKRYCEKYGHTYDPTTGPRLNALFRPEVVFAWREAPNGAEPDAAGKWIFPAS